MTWWADWFVLQDVPFHVALKLLGEAAKSGTNVLSCCKETMKKFFHMLTDNDCLRSILSKNREYIWDAHHEFGHQANQSLRL